jgi:WD40 repeat protein
MKPFVWREHCSMNEEQSRKTEDFMQIGGSPVPGIILRQVLQGHMEAIHRIAWSPDGSLLASPSRDMSVRIWEWKTGNITKILNPDVSWINCARWSPDGKLLATGSESGVISIWNTLNWVEEFKLEGHRLRIENLAWSRNSKMLASASGDATINVWSMATKQPIHRINEHRSWANAVEWSPDGKYLATGAEDNVVRIWKSGNWELVSTLDHRDWITDLAWSPDGNSLITASGKALTVWNPMRGLVKNRLEGHTERAKVISFSADGKMIASKSEDNTIRIWRTDSWETLAILQENTVNEVNPENAIAFHPLNVILATLGQDDTAIRIWEIDYSKLLKVPLVQEVNYATAKIVLLGNAGVGKTGLGWRLTHEEFREHTSTHGQQFWILKELSRKRSDNAECEAVLWDLAGQPDYRLIHSLFIDDVDTALLLFDPTNRQEPLAGIDFWLSQLRKRDGKLCHSILVGARTDRGISTFTEAELDEYCRLNGISGGYIATSALNGYGLSRLIEELKTQIPWEDLPATITTLTFKRIKDFVLELKQSSEYKSVLVDPAELSQQLEFMDPNWKFTNAEMMTAVEHLENHGYVTVLRNSKGKQFILLIPDLLANLASSIVLEARRNTFGLGVLEEGRLLRGEYSFPELKYLEKEDAEILLDAAAVLFLENHLCFRETFNLQTFLIFPSLINEKRPRNTNSILIEGPSYRVRGAADNVYASLVVLLGYTNTFIRTHQWQNQAQYIMGEEEVCGFQQIDHHNGELEFILYYGQNTPEPVRLLFRGLFERFLSRHHLEINRYQPATCLKCGESLARTVVMSQLGKGKTFTFCYVCGEKVSLADPESLTPLSHKEEAVLDTHLTIAQHRTAFEAALVRVKGILRDQGKEKMPSCFISYAWGISEHEHWVAQLAKDLRNAGIDVLLDRWHSPPGSDLGRYIDQIMRSDFVAVVGTPQLMKKYATQASDPVVATELRLINVRLREPSVYGQTVIPVLLEGDVHSSFIPMLQTLVRVDFKQPDFYFRHLFDMIWRLYNLPFDNPLLEELQQSMTPQQKS